MFSKYICFLLSIVVTFASSACDIGKKNNFNYNICMYIDDYCEMVLLFLTPQGELISYINPQFEGKVPETFNEMDNWGYTDTKKITLTLKQRQEISDVIAILEKNSDQYGELFIGQNITTISCKINDKSYLYCFDRDQIDEGNVNDLQKLACVLLQIADAQKPWTFDTPWYMRE